MSDCNAEALARELQLARSMPLDSYSAYMYDAVWSVAAGAAAAAAASPSGAGPLSSSDFLREVASGSIPSFSGAAGLRRLQPSGDWDLGHTYVEITNFGTPGGAAAPRHAVVAQVDLTSMEVTLASDERIVWADGREYPYVSSPPARHQGCTAGWHCCCLATLLWRDCAVQ